MKGRIRNIFFTICFFSSLFLSALCAEEDVSPIANTQMPPKTEILRPQQEFDDKNLRDPFRDYFEEGASSEESAGKNINREAEIPLPTLTLQGIVSGRRLNQAIINNKIVKVGDAIEGALITSINKDGVSVFFSNKTYKISSPAASIAQGLKKETEGGQDEK